jgi:hypothetical protein
VQSLWPAPLAAVHSEKTECLLVLSKFLVVTLVKVFNFIIIPVLFYILFFIFALFFFLVCALS